MLDSARLMRDVVVLAADSLEGRKIGTVGSSRARAFLVRQLVAARLAPVNATFTFPFAAPWFANETITGVNVAAEVRGTVRPGRYLIVSAHYDHLGTVGGQIFHGANDNASGTATVLELARWFAVHPQPTSLLFVLFDGEEGGELGSRAFLDHPPVRRDSLIGEVNIDMVGRSQSGVLVAGSSRPNQLFDSVIGSVLPRAKVSLVHGHDRGPLDSLDNWIGRSDQASFAARNIPFMFFAVDLDSDYHRATDVPAHLDPAFLWGAATTIADCILLLEQGPASVPAKRR